MNANSFFGWTKVVQQPSLCARQSDPDSKTRSRYPGSFSPVTERFTQFLSPFLIALIWLMMFSCDRYDEDPFQSTSPDYIAQSDQACENGHNSNALVSSDDAGAITYYQYCNGVTECYNEPLLGDCNFITPGSCFIQVTTPSGNWGRSLNMIDGYNGWKAFFIPIEANCSSGSDTAPRSEIDFNITYYRPDVRGEFHLVRYRVASCNEGPEYGKRWLTGTTDFNGDIALRDDGSHRLAMSRFQVISYSVSSTWFPHPLFPGTDLPVSDVAILYNDIGIDGYVSGIFGQLSGRH